ncbi:hypothetical protein TNIN_371621 [Trichonephila inaurata madagascariensis]|uniref:Uncharacterized protein n=1 Tax=Trichonephila inaurata madagascariensis TaxID=2747483 RepID=A0A8X7CCD3_9ARAC|nr:hypothetical protein TNIN_371621 [Trichonephila inaurata madagascariensis]
MKIFKNSSGAPDLETAIKIQQQLMGMMNACGMPLYKWCSNSCHLLSKVSTDDREHVVGNDDHTCESIRIVSES